MSTAAMEVPESQRLIAVSLGKIAASRSQKGGINLHKNLLVATVLHKARTAYMIQHFARQRAVAQTAPPPTTTTATPQPPSVEMREQQQQPSTNVPDSSPSSSPVSSSSSPSAAAAPTFLAAPNVTGITHSASVAATPETGSVPDGADVSAVQVAECEDKENTPPPTTTPCGGDATLSPNCEKRLHGDCSAMDTQSKDSRDKETSLSSPSLSPRSLVVSHAQNNSRQDYVSSRKCSSAASSSSSCLLKRRRTMDSNHENVSAPKVRIVEARLSADSNPEPMQCDSPQISNLVNIFNTSFAGLSGAAGGDVSVRSVGQSLLSAAGHKVLSDNLTCAKEMKMGLDSSVRQPLVLSV